MATEHIILSDSELITEVTKAAKDERAATATVVALLAEVDARRLYLGEGYNSLFLFCTRALRMSEHAAYARIEAARAARRFPTILDRLADGRLSLTTVGLLVPHLTEENGEVLLNSAQHQSKRDVERLIAALHPQPDIPATIRALPARASAPGAGQEPMLPTDADVRATAGTAPLRVPLAATIPRRSLVVAPLAPRRYLLRVTITDETQRKLERARDLLRHQIPDGDPAAIIDRALTLLVSDTERKKFAATHRPSSARVAARAGRRSRRIPNAMRRAVWSRDEGRCAFNGHAGRCDATALLEFHHVVPFARGGATTTENLELRCRAHNGYEAERDGLSFRPTSATRSGPG